ncbi:homoserine dehydrogenase [Pseudactinotalea terrae]|uniref:homoserine dehydrogenase n=1 Tax=Pseudactinotalea terrae TaxID=1743262 RepID=UPI0012E2F76C|nr:homoserine dehydrogenase [Pseudactinotalea terrae]
MNHSEPPARLRVGLLGCGTVGTEVVRLLLTHRAELTQRAGVELELSGIAVRSLDVERDPVIPTELLTTDAAGVVDGSDVVVELLAGIDPARELLARALAAGTTVVSANKAVLATDGPELYESAEANGAGVFFEAAVAGAVPVVRGIRESLAGDRVTRVLGILNGTTNFILDEMTREGSDFSAVLARAQALGYAEADPSADVEGHDAAAKAAILASLAFHSRVTLRDVPTAGISDITAADIAAATEMGFVIKLLAIAETGPDGLAVRVHPALVPLDHPLAGVHGAYNAVVVDAEAAGTLMFYGAGAGGQPTASAVLGDLVSAARLHVSGARPPVESRYAALPVVDPASVHTRYLIRLEVADRAGVLAEIARVFAAHDVSLETLRQVATDEGAASLVLVSHGQTEAALSAVVAELGELEPVHRVLSILRVEGH